MCKGTILKVNMKTTPCPVCTVKGVALNRIVGYHPEEGFARRPAMYAGMVIEELGCDKGLFYLCTEGYYEMIHAYGIDECTCEIRSYHCYYDGTLSEISEEEFLDAFAAKPQTKNAARMLEHPDGEQIDVG